MLRYWFLSFVVISPATPTKRAYIKTSSEMHCPMLCYGRLHLISHTRFCFTSGCMCFHSSQLILENDIYLVANLNQRTIFLKSFLWELNCQCRQLFLLVVWYHNALTPKICKISCSFSATQISYPSGAEANLKKLSVNSSRTLIRKQRINSLRL